MAVPSVMIIDDDSWTASYFAHKVDQSTACNLVGFAQTYESGVQSMKRLKPSKVVLDINLDTGRGISLIREVIAVYPLTECLVLTNKESKSTFIASLKSGAKGYILKQYGLDMIMQLFHEFLNGGSPIPASLSRSILDKIGGADIEEREDVALSRKERDVLNLLAKGFSRKEVAELMKISINTVSTHLKHIYDKLGVNSAGAAVFEAMQMGLIRPSKSMQKMIISTIDTITKGI